MFNDFVEYNIIPCSLVSLLVLWFGLELFGCLTERMSLICVFSYMCSAVKRSWIVFGHIFIILTLSINLSVVGH